jgi:hypothetical protein
MPHGPAGLAFDKWHGWSASDTAASTSVLIVIPNHVDPRVWLASLVAGQIRPFGLKKVAARLAVAAFAHEAVGLRARDILREAGRVLVSVSRTVLALRE